VYLPLRLLACYGDQTIKSFEIQRQYVKLHIFLRNTSMSDIESNYEGESSLIRVLDKHHTVSLFVQEAKRWTRLGRTQ